MEIVKVVLTSILSAVALFIVAKVMGHKQIFLGICDDNNQLTLFESV